MPKEYSTPLSQELTRYIESHKMTQTALAELLNVDERTLRRWKNGEVALYDVRELRRIAAILVIPPQRLGIVAEPSTFSADQIEPTIAHLWSLVRNARYHEANTLVDGLLYDIRDLIDTEDHILLTQLAATQHIAGYIKSQITRANQAALPLYHYQEMASIARVLEDHTMLAVALTYAGDMLQRAGKVQEGCAFLEEACAIKQNDAATSGNAVQLLGRAYFKAQRLSDFDRAMKQAEEFAHDPDITPTTSSVKGQFNAGTVYEEYARSLGLLGRLSPAMDYLEKAEKAFTGQWQAQRRTILTQTAKAMILVHGGEITQGVEVAIEAADLCRQAGNIRLLDRVYGLQRHLDRLSREIGASGSRLRDALDGPVEY